MIHIKGFFVLLKHTFYEMRHCTSLTSILFLLTLAIAKVFGFFQVSHPSLLASFSLTHSHGDRKHYGFSSVSLNKAQESLKPIDRISRDNDTEYTAYTQHCYWLQPFVS